MSTFGGGKSEWQWEKGKDHIWVNERPDGSSVLLSRASKVEALKRPDGTLPANVTHISDPDQEQELADMVQEHEMEEGWA